MNLYTGIDLHSSNSYVGIIDGTGNRIFKKKLPNDPGVILNALAQYKNDTVGIVVESAWC
jgi:transposase